MRARSLTNHRHPSPCFFLLNHDSRCSTSGLARQQTYPASRLHHSCPWPPSAPPLASLSSQFGMAANDTPTSNPITRRLAHVEHIILIMSGKGGVGKSSSTVQLALTLHAQGHRVGVLDTDLTGPSIPRMLGLDGQGVHQSTDGWVPVYADGSEGRLAVMSVGFLLKSSRDSVVWRGPKKEGMIKQFLGDVRWGKLDYLLIDTPPGGSPSLSNCCSFEEQTRC